MHGIDLHFALWIALQREADRHVLGRLHQQRGVGLPVREVAWRRAFQQLLQIQPRIRIGFSQLFLQSFRTSIRIALHLPESSEQTDGLDHFRFLERHDSALPGRSCASRSSTAVPVPAGAGARHPVPGSVRNAPKRNHRTSSLASAAARVRAFRRGDQLQQLLRIVQPLLEFRSQSLRRNLRRHADVPGERVGRHKLHFIDL